MSTTPVDAAIDNLNSKVEKLTNVKDSIVAWARGIADQLRANAEAPEKINAIATKIDDDADQIAAVIEANT